MPLFRSVCITRSGITTFRRHRFEHYRPNCRRSALPTLHLMGHPHQVQHHNRLFYRVVFPISTRTTRQLPARLAGYSGLQTPMSHSPPTLPVLRTFRALVLRRARDWATSIRVRARRYFFARQRELNPRHMAQKAIALSSELYR
jgi:hypothetical protein